MRSIATVLAVAVALLGVVAGPPTQAQTRDPAAIKKLHDLAYPADTRFAIQRWRADSGRTGDGPLKPDETAALMAQPLPEFIGAMVGNPFTGMGIAVKHPTREAAEREAIKLCRENGGGSTCTRPIALRGDQCVAIVGYETTIDRRPTYRTSVAIGVEMERSMNAAKEACPAGATHPELCRPLVTFCGDGKHLKLFDGSQSSGETVEAGQQ